LLVKIDIDTCNKASHMPDEDGSDWPQQLRMRRYLA
jgi:hypothetical protein